MALAPIPSTTVDLAYLQRMAERHLGIARAAMEELPAGDPRLDSARESARLAQAVLSHFSQLLRAFVDLLQLTDPDAGPNPITATDHAVPPTAEGEGPTQGATR
jgi:hypothetical protein